MGIAGSRWGILRLATYLGLGKCFHRSRSDCGGGVMIEDLSGMTLILPDVKLAASSTRSKTFGTRSALQG